MGDILKTYRVRSAKGERPRKLRLYFDSGSPFTFVKRSACRGLANVLGLRIPQRFGGLGNGSFMATHVVNLEVELLGIWCRHLSFVVPDSVLTEDEDGLVGHDFMQQFDIHLALKRRDVVLNKAALKRAQVVRNAAAR